MRYSVLFASSLAVGALARPHLEQRARRYRIVTVTAIETVTVLVTVTLDINHPTGVSPDVSVDVTPTASSSLTSQSDIAAPGGGSISSTVTSSPSSLDIGPIITPSSSPVISVVLPSDLSASSIISVVLPSDVSASSIISVVLPSDVSASSIISVASVSPSPSSPPSNVGPQHISGPTQATLQAGTDYMNAVLYHHNAARANHGAGEMTWCADCEANARIAAEKCVFEHFLPEGVSEGQNLFTVSGNAFNVTAGITESWYKSELPFMDGHYGQKDIPDDVFEKVGHFTQVVWIDSTSVGCVSLDCGDRMIVNSAKSDLNKFTVCNYAPTGNINSQYDINVLPPISNNLGRWDD